MKYLLLLTLITTSYAQMGENRNSYYEGSFQKHSEMDYPLTKNNRTKYYEKLSEKDVSDAELTRMKDALKKREIAPKKQIKIKEGNAKILIGYIIKNQDTGPGAVIILDSNFSSIDSESFFSKKSIIGQNFIVQDKAPILSKDNSGEILDYLYKGDEVQVLKVFASENEYKDSTIAVYAIIDSDLVDESASKQTPSKMRGNLKSIWEGCQLNCCVFSNGKEK